MKLTILCENSVERVAPTGLLAEHGFACHISTPIADYLFDTGGGATLLENSRKLGIRLEKLSGVILSHGHRDHTGGLNALLELTGPVPVYAHPELFQPRFSNNDGQLREIGIPWSRQELEAVGGQFHLERRPQQLAPNLLLSGEIPRHQQSAGGDRNLLLQTPVGETIVDPLRDDLALYLKTEQGLVILLGCAHAGVINIIEHALSLFPQEKIALLLGGTHLKFCSPQAWEETLRKLQCYPIAQIGVAHCTGLKYAAKLSQVFAERLFFATVGTEIELGR